MQNLSNPKFVLKTIAIAFIAIVILVNSPALYQQGKALGAEIYKLLFSKEQKSS
ncbi:hypothetical protein F7734_38260 [Scytonema sp. UIC 10036]|uniref:hypothetical protein n=1 Tax=Scytonema sp. UIC 10036 TaxID=2304196 RepID=UPI0012DA615C|nr:hypothetical protein [Scytonema sp. UIC 10036]MUG97844.1 hypothetical protein [Scytonema sp. UIC 10036]